MPSTPFNIPRIVTELRRGNLVITPTDTIYGILADALNPVAVDKVFAAKHRDPQKPLLLLMSDPAMIRAYTTGLTPLEQGIIERYLPGPLTILLPKNSQIPDQITGGRPLVGIRIPNHPELLEIIHAVGHPLISTSANLAGEPAITHPSQLSPELIEHLAYIEDQGVVDQAPSSLIQVVDEQIKVLRSGPIAEQILRERDML